MSTPLSFGGLDGLSEDDESVEEPDDQSDDDYEVSSKRRRTTAATAAKGGVAAGAKRKSSSRRSAPVKAMPAAPATPQQLPLPSRDLSAPSTPGQQAAPPPAEEKPYACASEPSLLVVPCGVA